MALIEVLHICVVPKVYEDCSSGGQYLEFLSVLISLIVCLRLLKDSCHLQVPISSHIGLYLLVRGVVLVAVC